jgi:type II secretory pathway component PulJ
MFRHLRKDNRGTTLVELMLYIVISAIVLIEITGILSQVIYAQIRIQALAREDENARTVMRLMAQDVQDASVINTPADINSTGNVLNLADSGGNTIQYTLTSGQITRQVNNGTAVDITGSDVYVSFLQFDKETEAGVAPSINIQVNIQQSSTNTQNVSHYETTSAQREL